jgi:hypothetical protein
MEPRLRIEVEKFNRAMREMKVRLGNTATLEQVVDFEVAKIIETALRRTKAATVSGIRANQEGREWTTFEGKKYKLSNRMPRQLWLRIVANRRATLMRRLAARGLAKRSWLELARLLGVAISAPGFVQIARRPSGSGGAENVEVRRNHGSSGYGLQIANHSPLNQWSDARQSFFAAVAGRRKFYEQNLRRRVFDNLRSVAKKYPGLVVSE